MKLHLSVVRRSVDEMTDALGKRVEENIKPLVVGLRMHSVRTISSCEGHLDDARPAFPYVDVDKRDLHLLVELIQRQNRPVLPDGSSNENKWVIVPTLAEEVRLVPMNVDRPLTLLQEYAVEFGRFLQKLKEDNFL